MAALSSLPHVETLLLGGQDRGYDFSQLAIMLRENQIKSLVLFPDTGLRIKQELEKMGGYHPTILETSSMEEAVQFAFKNCSEGSICLLSTASPSYSIWKNFEEKGDLFQKFAKALGTS